MSIFKTKGFDTLIGKGTTVAGQHFCFSGAAVVDGEVRGGDVNGTAAKKSSLHVNGIMEVNSVVVHDLTVCGEVIAAEIKVHGILAIKKGCKVQADRIFYTTLVAEPGAIIVGMMQPIDTTPAA